MNSLEEYIAYIGNTSQPSMHDEMVWDTLTHEQKLSVARLVQGGVEESEAQYELGFDEGHRDGYAEGHNDGVEEGFDTALTSPEMTKQYHERMRELFGKELRDVVREVLNHKGNAQPVPSGNDSERVLPGDADVQPTDGP